MFLANSLPRFAVISIDAWVLVFTLIISLLAGITAGLAPALRLTKTNVNEALKQGARTDSDSGMGHLRSLLVVSEVALSLVLLVGAGLMIRTLWLLRGVDPGFDPNNVVTMQIVVPRTKFAAPIEQVQFFDSILSRVQTLPGVEAAGVIDDLPLSGGGSHQPIQIEGRPVVVMSEQPEVDVRLISQGYLHALHIPLRRGREFSPSDTADHTGVVLISETMARRYWPNEDPIGKHLTMTFFPEKPKEIIGIVGDVKLDALDIAAPSATLYVPLTQLAPPSMAAWRSFGLSLVARATSHVTSVASAVTKAVREIDPQTPVVQVATMDDVISNSLSQRRFNMFLLAVFAGLAVLLAAVGIYSVLAYAVRRRVREIGIRMALGAQISDVLHLVVVEGMTPALLGMIIGWAGALALSSVLSTLIYGVQPRDPLTFAAVSALLAIVALLATLIPAYRATKVEPVQALREE
jgi:predicted permease